MYDQNNLRIIVLIILHELLRHELFLLSGRSHSESVLSWQQQFITFIIQQQDFLFPNLINFRTDYSTYFVNVFIIQAVFSSSRIFEANVWRRFRIARRPNFSKSPHRSLPLPLHTMHQSYVLPTMQSAGSG